MTPDRRGTVYLVGAGPGDPDLVTVRGAELLRRADAVVYDALAPPELLELAPPSAERIDVGKRGHDAPTRSQNEICALLVRLAQEGKTVVRLKGGDPLVFGRGGEEASACRAAGVPFEIVPGVSSVFGALAYAGIPVTDRRHASSFTVVTGHKDPTPSARGTRWAEIAAGADTLVVLMGMRNLREIVSRLLQHGRSPDTPAAAVMLGTTPHQRVAVARLAELPDVVEREGFGTPSAVVVGDVVRLRSELRWFEDRPLFGRRVLVTRAEDQAQELAAALRAAGAEPVVVPLIRSVPLEDLGALDAALEKLDSYDAVLFTSRNAVRVFADRYQGRADPRPAPAALCVGPATADEALGRGLPVRRLPGEPRFDAEGLLARMERWFRPAGRRFLFPCAEGARDVLPRGLVAAGGLVDRIPVYRTEPAPVDRDSLRQRLVGGDLDVLTFTSPSTVRAFVGALDEASRRAAEGCLVGAIGPVTARALEREGFAAAVVAEQSGIQGLVEALGRAVQERRRTGSP